MVVITDTLDKLLKRVDSKEIVINEKIDYFLDSLDRYTDLQIRLYSKIFDKPFQSEVKSVQFVDKIKLAIKNIGIHAHNLKDKPYFVTMYEGTKGYVVTIKYSGKGFDHEAVQNMYKNGECYWNKGEGAGFAEFNMDDSFISFEEGGTRINIMTFKKKSDIEIKLRDAIIDVNSIIKKHSSVELNDDVIYLIKEAVNNDWEINPMTNKYKINHLDNNQIKVTIPENKVIPIKMNVANVIGKYISAYKQSEPYFVAKEIAQPLNLRLK
ncbi:MAG: hypothetical protein ABH828_06485 [archaeon]